MKVFISHSSKDKWAARRISEDLLGMGMETFLDEKDIQSGESIDTSIKKHLKECNDFLIILSPASIKSEWVLIELGGAFALEKRVVPILLYVGANEIPKLISLKLARDINNIQNYYDEIINGVGSKKLLSKKKTVVKKKKENSKRNSKQLKVGDKVKIVPKKPEPIFRSGDNDIHFADEMVQYLGGKAKITAEIEDGDFSLDIDNGEYAWAKNWLIPTD